MKKCLILILSVMLSVSMFAAPDHCEKDNKKHEKSCHKEKHDKQETLLKGRSSCGGYGGLVWKGTQINGEFAMLAGVKGGWVINHSFVIGLAGYGLGNEVDPLNPVIDLHRNVEFGYGGVFMEGVFMSNKMIHLTAGVLVGAGGIALNDRHGDFDVEWDDVDAVYIIEPEINVELNVAKFFRVGLGVSYRFVSGVDHTWTSNKEMSGYAAGLSLKWGKF